ncbi:galactose mutarotase-like [Anthonomus grandis grandis]|uniref:galactose mutarotase-like n=1 Tax=Anthonomus grandis grandis TaxID=2921223 RepID=UPI002165560B|nr:galactose mutarotase-like [Anthonomus grandis grandis]
MCCRMPLEKPAVWMSEDEFGRFTDSSEVVREVRRFTWENVRNTKVQVINYGATITSIQIPDKNGKIEDIVTGFDTIEEYFSEKNRYYGATIGRVANRTAKGEMNVDGIDYKLAVNNGPNHLHGGLKGFDKVLWNYRVDGTKLILTYHSKDMEEGYPGDLIATVTMQLTPSNQFQIDYKAVVTKTTPVNMTNHTYFNLGGIGSGSVGLYQHEITINADKYTEVDSNATPTGNLIAVSGTTFDLRVPKLLGDVIHKVPNAPGYDHNFCITRPSTSKVVTFVAKALHKPSGRAMEVYSDQPGVQFYTGNFIPESEGKGAKYVKHGAFCLETQIYPDAVHHANFPEVLVYPGQEYRHFTSFNFMVQE